MCFSLQGFHKRGSVFTPATSSSAAAKAQVWPACVCCLREAALSLALYTPLQADLGDLSAAGNCSKNAEVDFIPLASVEISAVNEIEKCLFSGVLDSDSALIYPVMTS